MPIYEYVCRECGEPVEKLQKLSDPPLTDCPVCGEPALKRKVSAAGFRLSGGGWYETDFKKDGKRNIAGERKEQGSSAPKGDAGSSGAKKTGDKSKSDSKSAGKNTSSTAS